MLPTPTNFETKTLVFSFHPRLTSSSTEAIAELGFLVSENSYSPLPVVKVWKDRDLVIRGSGA